jgi:glycine cleavage system H protein
MSNLPENLKYAKTHEWARLEGDGTVTVGISDHAQHELGDLVFLELPDEGDELAVGDDIGVVESVKAASDVFSPVAGEVIEINLPLIDEPELINQSPYEKGWLIKLKPADVSQLDDLLTAKQYAEHIADDEE